MNLAIISPGRNTYSETFIQAHKRIKADKVFFYYGGAIPTHVENQGIFNLCKEALTFKNLFGIAIHCNPFAMKIHGFSIKEQLFATSLNRNKIDVVLAEFGPTAVACSNVCKELGIPLIAHFHGYDITAVLDKYKEDYVKLFKTAAYIVGVSREMTNKLVQLGAPEDKIIYTPCGPNPHFLATTPDRNSKKLLSVGRFTDKKAPYYTILAFMKVLEKHPSAKLLMVGDGELLPTCRNLVSYLGMNDSVKFLGIKNPEEIEELHNQVSAFLQHSITAFNGDKEGTPVGILEASLSSLPVISTRHAGIKDVIIENETGLLCNEHDVDRMAKNIIYLLDNPDIATKMGLKGRKNVMEHYTLQHHLDILSKAVKDAYNSSH